MGKRITIIAVAVLVAAFAIVGFRWGLIPVTAGGTYYTQIDNAKIQEQESSGGVIDPTGGMPWLYTLQAYNVNGDRQEISFGTERKLRDDAYLQLTVVPIRGVMDWKEVQFDEIPSAVQARMR